LTDFIIKRSGQKVPFDVTKLAKWAEWAANKNVDWQPILETALKRCPNGVTTKDFHKALIDTCTESLDFDKVQMAGRLLIGQLYKDVFGKFGTPSLKSFYKQMVKDGLWEDMYYSDEELDELDSVIDHTKDLGYSYTTIRQVIDKYLVKNKVTKQIHETPQFMFMGMALMTMKDDITDKIKKVSEWYNDLSNLKWNSPTPIMNAWRTPFKSYASCCIFKSDDEAESIEAAQHIAYTMTTAQAGIGGYLDTRSIHDPVNAGRTVHMGKLPYYKMFDTTVRSTKQGDRSGALTMYYPCLDPEIETLLKLKNVKTPLDKRINLIDYGFQVHAFFWKKVSKQDNWMLVSRYYAPKLYELFFSKDTKEFELEYDRVFHDQSIPKQIIWAVDIAKSFVVNRQETGRIYPWWADAANNQTPFKDRIHSSNLCVEVDLPTKGFKSSEDLYRQEEGSGEVAMCNLSAYVLNDEDTDEDIGRIYTYGVKMVDKSISEMVYPLPSIEFTANARRSLGIGLTNLAYLMAKKGLSYSSKAGKEFIHQVAERHSYFLHKASLSLGKELGNATWIHKTKYPNGWFPHDDSSTFLNSLGLNLSLKYDWEVLRKEIISNGGIRNSVLEAHMPCESSSQVSNAVNGLYPVRELVIIKRSGSNLNVFFAPEYNNPLVRYFYESAYDVPPKDMLECYGLVQKFSGQGISADTWLDLSKGSGKMSLKEQLQLMILATRLGLKSLYYQNTRTDSDTSFDVTDDSCESCKM
jgi:ribonucleoside-diphosphate reductase alpha chain